MSVVLKKLENVERANKSWLEEGISHLHISSKGTLIVECFGLTQNPFNGNYMLVMSQIYKSYCQNENYEQIINITNTYNSLLNTKFNVNSSSTINSFFENSSKGSSNWNNSRVYSFENFPEPRNATKAFWPKAYFGQFSQSKSTSYIN
ncbi:kinase-like domain-containing protein [Rhizophagus irregularis DAOM 181602=DAOM 197198]|nr:kinase-like domain-containing protein [Rhizophagus irregularis DAOM 181602=DAOM 197198]